jgi:tRNA 2-thiocytidine biosynthesis protein TtcA
VILRIVEMPNKLYKRLNRNIGKALHHYQMINNGDRLLVGLSGGKDSLTLLWFLRDIQQRAPIQFDVRAVYVDPGFEEGYGKQLKDYCCQMDYPLQVEYTDFGVLAHSMQNRENPCFLCARLRRKRLFEVAEEQGRRKLALGHHKDDIIETLFLNIFYSGEISTMVPAQSLFKGRYTVVRPLAYVEESDIRAFARKMKFPEFINNCPSAGHSKRQTVKTLLRQLYRTNRKIKGNIFRSMSHVHTEYLLKA